MYSVYVLVYMLYKCTCTCACVYCANAYTCMYNVHLQELQSGHLSELENEAKLKEEKLTHTVQQMTTAQENYQVFMIP